jgi:hypothetical protein
MWRGGAAVVILVGPVRELGDQGGFMSIGKPVPRATPDRMWRDYLGSTGLFVRVYKV